MTVTLPDLVQPLKWDGADFESGIERAITKGSALGNVFGNVVSGAISGAFRLAGQGAQFLFGEFQKGIDDLMEVQDVQAQLNAVLESTGGIAGVTADKANELADSFENVTKFSAETVLTGENLLLTFTNIGQDVFPQAVETMLDMSQAMGQGMKESAVQLGKALQDPILGVTALRRVGVNFNEEQQETIRRLVESGDLMAAQTMILKELQVEFGGSARAAGETFGGQLEILNNKIGEVREGIVSGFMPVLQESATALVNWISSPEFQAGLENFTNWIQAEAVPWVLNLKDNIIAFVEEAALGFTDFQERTADEVEVIGSEWDELVKNGRALFSSLFEEEMPSMAEVGETALQAIAIGLDAINKALEAMIGWVEEAKASWDLLNGAIGLARERGANRYPGLTAGLPGYADGGMVPGPLGAPQLAVVHGGERVQTPEQQQSANPGGRSDAAWQKILTSSFRDALLQADRGR